MYTPERRLPTSGQHGHSPQQRHTAAGTAALATTDTGVTVPQRANSTQTAYARSRKRAQAQVQSALARLTRDPIGGMRELPEGGRRDTGGGASVTPLALPSYPYLVALA